MSRTPKGTHTSMSTITKGVFENMKKAVYDKHGIEPTNYVLIAPGKHPFPMFVYEHHRMSQHPRCVCVGCILRENMILVTVFVVCRLDVKTRRCRLFSRLFTCTLFF